MSNSPDVTVCLNMMLHILLEKKDLSTIRDVEEK
jgi:hypothetical protein